MVYDRAFFEHLRGLISDPVWDVPFDRPDLEFEKHHLKPSYCHSNVERWVADHPAWTRVRGWLVSPFAGGIGFIAHSLAAGPEGELWDVTRYLDARTRDLAKTFIKHPGSDDQFDSGVSEHWGKEYYLHDPDQMAEAVRELSGGHPYFTDEENHWDEEQ